MPQPVEIKSGEVSPRLALKQVSPELKLEASGPALATGVGTPSELKLTATNEAI